MHHINNALLILLYVYLGCYVEGMPHMRPFLKRDRSMFDVPDLKDVQLFTQILDHFDSKNPNTWSQRYTVNTAFYKEGGPTFIFLAGEAPMEFFEFQEVQALKWAADFNANYISLEHRFYGESIPTANFSTNNLQYLSSQQALADAANFVNWMQTKNESQFQGKWVVLGCSYSGALSAWFRLKFPNLVVASVAPSGPVEAQLNFTGYYGQFAKSAGNECAKAAAMATQQIAKMVQTSDGLEALSGYFNSCKPLQEEDTYYFLYTITEVLGSADQMDNPPVWNLYNVCESLEIMDGYVANWGALVQNASNYWCTDFSESNFISSVQNVAIAAQDGTRAWTWQTCTEFGYFSTSYEGTSVFFSTLDLEHQLKWCEQIFGIPGMTPHIEYTNSYYGGWNISGTNIMFTNGLIDPWHLLSINEDFSNGDVLAATYEAGHCATMIESTTVDPQSLTQARQRVAVFLAQVLAS